jgi:ATP-binding cassette, subfamily A (ABC1), member 3
VGWILAVHLLLGLSLASWSFFIAIPFGKSPQLAAVSSTFLAILFAIAALVFTSQTVTSSIPVNRLPGRAAFFSLVFPPSFYIFAIRAICGYENNQLPINALQGDPDYNLELLPLVIVAVVCDPLYSFQYDWLTRHVC